jgi:hypothetical protein
MIHNLIGDLNIGRLYRLDVIFAIQGKSVDNIIGRTAHICFLDSISFIKSFLSYFSLIFSWIKNFIKIGIQPYGRYFNDNNPLGDNGLLWGSWSLFRRFWTLVLALCCHIKERDEETKNWFVTTTIMYIANLKWELKSYNVLKSENF